MLDQLLSLGGGQITELLKQQGGIDESQLPNATSAITESLAQTFSSQLQNGDISSISEMFSGSETSQNSPIISQLAGPVAANLASKLGINGAQATQIISTVLPLIMNMFNGQVNNAKGNGVDVGSLIGQLAGGNLGNIGSLLGLLGGNQSNANGNDGFGLDDMINIGKKFF